MLSSHPKLISCAEFARRLGCDESTVRRYIQAGKIYGPAVAYKASGKVAGLQFESAKAQYLEAREVTEFRFAMSSGAPTGAGSANHRSRREARQPRPEADSPPLPPGPLTMAQLNAASLAQVRKRLLQLRIRMAEIKVGQLTGKLLSREDVYRELYERGNEVRNRFEMIPDRITDRLLAAPSRAAALEILQAEFADALAFAGAAIARPLRISRERR